MVLHAEIVQVQNLYSATKKWFAILSVCTGPVLLFYDAPFGRFSSKNQDSLLLVDGLKAWMIMESTSFITCVFGYLTSPLSFENYGHPPELSLSNPSTILAGLFLVHYINRAFVSPLRTPSRSKFHIIIPLSALTFTMINGTLMGSYLSSPDAESFLSGALSRPLFWFGVGLWAFGFIGNIVHDEILFNLRRKNIKLKANAKPADDNNGKDKQEHYAIPHGYMYSLISYPNYFCEWLEWLGFALAAAPIPSLTSLDSFQPPWVFLLSELTLMLPRAYRGHKWYYERFPDYPKERKAVIPFVL
ncbi:3-oxo-5-alpha-steroid 4-dehydrogenase-domain-containing protein [Cytidiella melzeri]|nr:3-oxo-5-alpha-steroid 4-dehydrogenase-domain-containing protein [Cytidiella melzeri]